MLYKGKRIHSNICFYPNGSQQFYKKMCKIESILLIIEGMFNGAIVDLAEKPYIPQKKYFYEFVANVLRDNIL